MIVFVSWLDYLATSLGIGFLRTLRLLRAFRPLRMLSKVRGLQLIVASLMESMNALTSVFMLTLLVYMLFAIFAVSQFKGKLARCNDDGVYTKQECAGSMITTAASGSNLAMHDIVHVPGLVARTWANPDTNFDSTPQALYALYEVTTLNLWEKILHRCVDAVGVDMQPSREHSMGVVLFFIVFIFCSNYFLINLFVGVTYERYHAQLNAGLELLNLKQRQWLEVSRLLLDVRVEPQHSGGDIQTLIEGTTGVRQTILRLVTTSSFDNAMLVVILLNCAQMSSTYYPEPQSVKIFHQVINYIFTGIYASECGLKIFGLGFVRYYSDGWNRFDFYIVMMSVVDIIMTLLDVSAAGAAALRVFRIARVAGRVARLLRVAKQVQGLQIISRTFVAASQSLAYMGVVLVLVIFIFAVLGMNLFGGKLKHTHCINDHFNFRSVPVAMRSLYGMATHNQITCMTHAASEHHSTGVARLFFMVFGLLVMFIMIGEQ